MTWLPWWRAWGAALAAIVLVIWASWEYVAEVARGEDDPRLASWVIWTASMSVGAAGAWLAGQPAAAGLGAIGGITCAAVLLAGYRHGSREVGWVDAAGCACGGAGLVLLVQAMLHPGTMPVQAAISAAVVTDIAAFWPTWRNAARGREPAAPWLKYGLAAVVAITATDLTAASLIFPVYELSACGLAAALAVWGKARASEAARREAARLARVAERAAAVIAVRQADRVREILTEYWAPAMAACWHAPEPLAQPLAEAWEPSSDDPPLSCVVSAPLPPDPAATNPYPVVPPPRAPEPQRVETVRRFIADLITFDHQPQEDTEG